MQFPDDDATRLTEQIMARIQDHLKRDPSPQENFHYNRVYEQVRAVLAAQEAPDEGLEACENCGMIPTGQE